MPEANLPYTILCRGSWKDLKSLSDLTGRIFRDYGALFEVGEESLPRLLIRVMARSSEEGGDNAAGAVESAEYPALYRPDPPRIVFRGPPDGVLLLHEIAHHFIRACCGSRPAVSLDEGLATYLGWSAFGEDRLLVGQVAVEHCRKAHRAVAEGAFVPLGDFFTMDAGRFYAPGAMKLHYAEAWAFVYFYFHRRLPPSLSFRAKVDRLCALDRKKMAAMDGDFRRFCRDFSPFAALKEGLDSSDKIQRMSSAFRLGLLQDGGAADALIALALEKSEDPVLREVALMAAGIIVVGPEGRAFRGRFLRALKALVRDPEERVRRAAASLFDEMERGNLKAIQERYGALGCGTAFYPAGRFRYYAYATGS